MDKVRALHNFWNSFGIPAYDEATVPDDAKLPYLTYTVVDGELGDNVIGNSSLWYRSTNWTGITEKAEQISRAITRGGKIISYDDGALCLRKETPFSRRMPVPEDDMIRRILLQYSLEFFD